MSATTSGNVFLAIPSVEECEMFERLLRVSGRNVQPIRIQDGNELLARIDECPGCVVLDSDQPDMNGLELLGRLRSRSGGRLPCAIVLVTARDNKEIASEALRLGAQDCLAKSYITAHALTRSVELAITRFALEGERAEAEAQQEELRLAKKRFELALRDSPIVVFCQDLDLRYTWIYNAALGYQSEEVVGKTDGEVFERPEDATVTEALKRAVIETGVGQRKECSIYWNGALRLFDLIVDPLLDASGKIVGVTCAAIDITERKELEAELKQARADMEERVEQRTRQLEGALDTLEAEVAVRMRTEERLRQLSARLLRTQDDERRRIARELHDSTGQTLAALKMMLSRAKRMVGSDNYKPEIFEEMSAMADQAIADIRTTSYLLHPPLLEESGFASAARWYVQGFQERSGIRVDIDVPEIDLPKELGIVLFRILQEGLTNVLRHSGSNAAEIEMKAEGNFLRLSIRDFGKGMPADKLAEFEAVGTGMGIGLSGMRERVHQIDGNLQIVSDNSGTLVSAVIPLTRSTTKGAAVT